MVYHLVIFHAVIDGPWPMETDDEHDANHRFTELKTWSDVTQFATEKITRGYDPQKIAIFLGSEKYGP